MKQKIYLFSLLLFLSITVNARIWYVKTTGSGTDGSTWATAVSLQFALETAVADDEIWVASGTYFPSKDAFGNVSPSDLRDKTFYLPNGVKIYGGFVGTETLLTQRNNRQNLTILSGDIGTANNISDNAYHVVLSINDNSDTQIDGFTITKGNANGSSIPLIEGEDIEQRSGAGMLCVNGQIKIKNLILSNNIAFDAGAGMVFAGGGNSTTTDFENVVFDNNLVGNVGGGLVVAGTTIFYARNLVFNQNETTFSVGGGLFVTDSRVLLFNANFHNNKAFEGGGAYFETPNSGNNIYVRGFIFRENRKETSTTAATADIKFGPITSGSVAIRESSMQLANNTTNYPSGLIPSTGNLFATDPQYRNSANPKGNDGLWMTNDDGLLALNSATYDVFSSNSPPLMTDIRGVPRFLNPSNTFNIDMGAYERNDCLNTFTNNRAYVNINATGANTGVNWANAFTDFQAALTVARSCGVTEIWVAQGTYKPTTTTDRNISFSLINDVAIYGGFEGIENLRTQRNWKTNKTIFSGDIGVIGDNADNTSRIFYNIRVNSSAILDGVIIRDGNAFQFIGGGGGMFNADSSPTLSNIIFINNNADQGRGGAMYNFLSSPTITNAIFIENTASQAGAILNQNSSSIFVNALFINNAASNGTAGAVVNSFHRQAGGSTIPSFTNCTFLGNTSTSGSSTIENFGEVIFPLKNCIVWGNGANNLGTGTTATYSNIQQGSGVFTGTGNINQDPLFVNTSDFDGADNLWFTADDGLLLKPCSPSVDAATTGAGVPTTDIVENPRFDMPNVGTSIVDMGAYETPSAIAIPTVTPPSPLVVCFPNTLTLTASCATGTVLWSNNATGTSLTIQSVGTYPISAKCTLNGCDSDASAITILEIKAKPNAPTISTPNQLSVCFPNTLTLSATCSTGNVVWSDNSTGNSLTLSAVGIYAISAKCTLIGCDSDASAAVNLEIKAKPNAPTVSAPSQLVVCFPNTLTLSATCSTGNVVWSDNSTGNSLTLLAVGVYAISAKCTLNGCDSDASGVTNLEIKAKPTTPTITPPSQLVVCSPNTLTLTASCTTGNVVWSDNSTGASLTLSAVGTYTISAKCQSNGCDSDASSAVSGLEIKQTPAAPTIGATTPSVVCSASTINLTASGCAGTVLWSNNATGTSLALSAVGTYSITATCAVNGCTSDASTAVPNLEIKQTPAAPSIGLTTSAVVCFPSTINLTASGCAGTVSWSNAATGTSLTFSAVGTYSLTATCTVNGCPSGASMAVSGLEIKALPVPSASNNGPYLFGQTISLSASGGSGTPLGEYAWTGPNSFSSTLANPTINNAQPPLGGTYTVTVTNVGCSATATTNVVVSGVDPCVQILAYDYVLAGNPSQTLFNLTNGQNIAQRPTATSIIVRPICNTVTIGSVEMIITGPSLNWTTLQNVEPFALFDNSGNNIYGQVLALGTYSLTVTGFFGDNRTGGTTYGPIVMNFTIGGEAPTISTPTLTGSEFCAGTSVNVSFTTTGTFAGGNLFQVLLSDPNGSFNNPQIIGTSTVAGSVLCTIPPLALGGENYKIKVISTDPAAAGNYNLLALKIYPLVLNLVSPTNDYPVGTATKKAVQTINARNNITGLSIIQYKAGNAINLTPGFQVVSHPGSSFKAQIEGCDN